MKYVKTIDGHEFKVGVRHAIAGDGRRYTEAYIKGDDGVTRTATAKCNPEDNFCRRIGRKLAAERLLDEIRQRDVTSKEFRRQVFQIICPEYAK